MLFWILLVAAIAALIFAWRVLASTDESCFVGYFVALLVFIISIFLFYAAWRVYHKVPHPISFIAYASVTTPK